MSPSGSKSRLSSVTKQLLLQWEQTKNHWRDARSREFEQRYLQELFISVDKTITVIEKLDELLKKVRSDCE
jgi:hypothetical protein